ncbi:hypothetical protein FRC18_007105 [Serendipita sp. 400]|nr:hypothetical protein FRC18_007105 [Serendipita sp. 400]
MSGGIVYYVQRSSLSVWLASELVDLQGQYAITEAVNSSSIGVAGVRGRRWAMKTTTDRLTPSVPPIRGSTNAFSRIKKNQCTCLQTRPSSVKILLLTIRGRDGRRRRKRSE